MLNPRATAWSIRGGGSGSDVRLQSATANLLFGNLAIDAGSRLHDLRPIAGRRTFVFRQRADVGHGAHLERPARGATVGATRLGAGWARVYSSRILATTDRSIREPSSLDTTSRFCRIQTLSLVRKS